MGGRKKGTPNKVNRTLAEKAAELGCDPFEILCHFAMNNFRALGYSRKDSIDPKLRKSAAADAAEYLYPKRRAIEMTGQDGSPIQMYMAMTEEERAARKRALETLLNPGGSSLTPAAPSPFPDEGGSTNDPS